MLKKANTLAYWPSAYGHQGKATCKMSYRKTHHPYDIGVYKKLKNKLKSSVHEAKLHYLQSLLEKSKCDPHSFHDLWLDVNNIIGRRKSSVGAMYHLILWIISSLQLLWQMNISQLLSLLLFVIRLPLPFILHLLIWEYVTASQYPKV